MTNNTCINAQIAATDKPGFVLLGAPFEKKVNVPCL